MMMAYSRRPAGLKNVQQRSIEWLNVFKIEGGDKQHCGRLEHQAGCPAV